MLLLTGQWLLVMMTMFYLHCLRQQVSQCQLLRNTSKEGAVGLRLWTLRISLATVETRCCTIMGSRPDSADTSHVLMILNIGSFRNDYMCIYYWYCWFWLRWRWGKCYWHMIECKDQMTKQPLSFSEFSKGSDYNLTCYFRGIIFKK